MNSVVLIGRLTKDPELRFIPSGKAVATFGLAVNNSYSKEKQADFFNIVVWGKTAENCANYLAKGRLVGVKGRLQTRNYENKQGIKVYITEI
ncbi:single-stranded DNA-binding protein, partial [bacterium AH-315-G05]|nr:single-stranded DNA-binding protein [bacterium AH-315-G05]